MIQLEEEQQEYEERCTCGHEPRQHRWIRAQYRRPDSFPCDECNCFDFELALTDDEVRNLGRSH